MESEERRRVPARVGLGSFAQLNSSGNEFAFGEIETQGPVGGLGESDSGGGDARPEAAAEGIHFGIFGDEYLGVRVAEVGCVEGAIDREGDAEFARTAGESGVFFDGAIRAHPIHVELRFNRADEDGFAGVFGGTDGVKAMIESVDKINVGVAWWAEHRAVAVGGTDECVTAGIVRDVGFGFDDGSASEAERSAAKEIMAKQARRDDLRGGSVEGTRERREVGHE